MSPSESQSAPQDDEAVLRRFEVLREQAAAILALTHQVICEAHELVEGRTPAGESNSVHETPEAG